MWHSDKCDINLLQRQGIKFICYWKARLAHISASNPSQFVQEMTQGIFFVSKSTPSFCLPKTYRMKREVIKSLPWTKYLAPPLYDQHNWKKVQMDPQNFTGILKILWNCLKQTSSGSCWGDKLSAKHLYDPRRILSIHSNSTFYKCLFNILSHPKNKIIVKITISVWNRVSKTHIEIKLGFMFIFHALLSY